MAHKTSRDNSLLLKRPTLARFIATNVIGNLKDEHRHLFELPNHHQLNELLLSLKPFRYPNRKFFLKNIPDLKCNDIFHHLNNDKFLQPILQLKLILP